MVKMASMLKDVVKSSIQSWTSRGGIYPMDFAHILLHLSFYPE